MLQWLIWVIGIDIIQISKPKLLTVYIFAVEYNKGKYVSQKVAMVSFSLILLVGLVHKLHGRFGPTL